MDTTESRFKAYYQKEVSIVTANWKVLRTTLTWLLIAIVTMGIVIASPYAIKSDAASNPTVKIQKVSNGKWGAYVYGKIDKSITGFYKNENGWWYVKNGYVDFSANGIYKNKNNGVWYKTTNGKVTFKETGVFKNDNGWWRVKDSRVDFNAQGIYKNKNGWWKTTNGKVTFQENGVFKNENGWWKVEKSKVNFNFNGIASNEKGTWYLKDGKVRFEENGAYYDKETGKNYIITNGRATETSKVDPEEPIVPDKPVTPVTPVIPDDQKPSAGEDNKELAVEVAKETLQNFPLSRALLIDVLTDEEVGFTQEEAVYGADHCGANWNDQAFLVAADLLYDDDLNPTGISRAMLEASLGDPIDEDGFAFTKSEVQSAMAKVDADAAKTKNFWEEQALASANLIIELYKEDKQTPTKDDIKEVLEIEEFTSAQITYALNHIKL